MICHEIREQEDVGDDIDKIEDDQDVGVVAVRDIVCVMGEEEQRGEHAQQEYFVRKRLEGDGVLHLGIWNVTAE